MARVRGLVGAVVLETVLSFVSGLATALGENLANRLAPPKREQHPSGDEKEK